MAAIIDSEVFGGVLMSCLWPAVVGAVRFCVAGLHAACVGCVLVSMVMRAGVVVVIVAIAYTVVLMASPVVFLGAVVECARRAHVA